MSRKEGFLLLIFFLLGLLLRLVGLAGHPAGFTPDEAAQGYTAYSILKTGRDEWGVKLPLNPRSFGDFKPPLQTYLIVPSVAVFGLNEFAVRFPNALLSSLAIIGVFLLAKELLANNLIALLSSFLIAFSPWHLPLSRGGFEANLTVFFTSFGGYFLWRALKEKRTRDQVLAGLFLGLNMFSYHSAKLITPLVVFFFFFHFFFCSRTGSCRRLLEKNSRFIIIYSLFFLIACLSFFSGGQTRGADVVIFSPTDSWQMVKDERWFSVNQGLPDLVARSFHNKFSYSLSLFFKNYLSYLSLQFFFSEGPGEGTYGMIPGRGVLWWWQLPVLFFGLYSFWRKPTKEVLLVLLLILLAPIPAALTKGVRAANRAAVMMPWIQIFLGWSLYQSNGWFFEKTRLKRRLAYSLAGLVFLLFLAFFLEDYFIQQPRKTAKEMLYGRCQALRGIADNADRVVVSRKLSEPQAYVMFCLGYDPLLAQKEVPSWIRYQKEGLGFIDQLGEYSLGRFVFKEINFASDSKLENSLLIGLPEEFPEDIEPAGVVNYPNGDQAVIIYQTLEEKVYASVN